MIGYNRQYKGLDFSDTTQEISIRSNGYGVVLQDEVHIAPQRTDTRENANYHGGYSSETLVGPRVFTFTGKIVGETKALRHTARYNLISRIQTEQNPGAFGRGFYDLTFLDDGGNARTVSCKVFRMPEPTHELDSPVIDFSFDLYSETEKIYGATTKTATGTIGYIGGNTFSTTFPTPFSSYAGGIDCDNEGNWASPIRVSVVGEVTNPKIINATNGNKYRITGTTSNLIFDNRNLQNIPSQKLIVTDQGGSIRSQRSSGAGIYLDAGVNEIVILADSFVGTPIVTITWRDAFIY